MLFKEKVYLLQAFFELYKYQKIYKKVLPDGHKRENDRFILRSTNRSKALWQIIKKESGNGHKINLNTLEAGAMSISNPQFIPYQFNSFLLKLRIKW
jgi:hypothetical protein